jgi:hypothetical protein
MLACSRRRALTSASSIFRQKIRPQVANRIFSMDRVDVRTMIRDAITNMHENNVYHEKCSEEAAE